LEKIVSHYEKMNVLQLCLQLGLVAILNCRVKTHYGGAKIVVTLYYFSGVSCLKFNHVIIIKDFHKFFHFGHIHNQGTQKDGLMEKGLQKLFWIFITFTIS